MKATSQQPGQVLVGAFGGIQELHCNDDMVIDTGHLVAWDATLNYSIGKSGSGWIASWLSGEGLVCNFSGQGRIWIQSRNASEYGQTVGAMLPPRRG
ncbi:MAG: AIM24 family protein [Sandaracinaceae bacterium]|nr:AIM24 family protein [Sandaracinaceae bacterium]